AVSRRGFLRLVPLRDHLGRVRELLLVHVAQRDDFDRRNLNEAEQVALAVPPGADEPDAIRLLLGLRRPGALRPEHRHRHARRTGLEEVSTVHATPPKKTGPNWIRSGAAILSTVQSDRQQAPA